MNIQYYKELKELKERAKMHKQDRQNATGLIVVNWCEKNNVDYDIINAWQFRVFASNKIDIFLQSKKYHNITKNERGRISGTIIEFLNPFIKDNLIQFTPQP